MKRIMQWLMISCRKAGELIEKKLHKEITPIERVELALHTSLCQACRTYEKQSKTIEEAIESKQARAEEKAPEGLTKKLNDLFN